MPNLPESVARTRRIALTETELAAEAGSVTFARGREYALAGKVRLTVIRGAYLAAQVTGSAPYATELGRDQAGLVWSCSCPVGRIGDMCKHVVALGLAHIQRSPFATGEPPPPPPLRLAEAPPRVETPAPPRAAVPAPAPAAAPATEAPQTLEAFVRAQSAETLAEWLLEAAKEDPQFEHDLMLRMEPAGGESGLRRLVARVIGAPGYLNYRQTREFAGRVAQLNARLASALGAESDDEVLDALDAALKRLFKVYARADDTGGQLAAELRALAGLHVRAVAAVVPDAKSLGASLQCLVLEDQWGFVRLDDYAMLLGDAGFEAYRKALLKAWGALPAGPVMRHGPHANLVAAMEAWYDRAGDLDGWLSLKSRLADNPWVFREVIDRLMQAGRRATASEWVERALTAFPKDRGVRGIAATHLAADGRIDAALALAWDNFTDYPSTTTYALLRECAGERWPDWHAKAHQWMQDQEAMQRERSRQPTTADGEPLAALRLSVLIEDGELDRAWQLAEESFAPPYLLARLADRLAVDAPARAATLYRSLIPLLIDRAIAEDYSGVEEALEKLKRVTPQSEFEAFVASLAQRHRANTRIAQVLRRR